MADILSHPPPVDSGLRALETNMPGARPYVFNAAAHAHLIPYLAALQGQCITQDRMIGTFLPPLNHDKLLVWWREKIAEANAGTRTIFILLEESDPGSKAKGNELVGAVMLGMPKSETSPFRAHVESLLIHTRYRKRGGARQLMAVLHTEASQKGKTLLVSGLAQLISHGSLPIC